MLKIMVADDEEPIREWIEFSLRKANIPMKISLFKNGQDAWSAFQQEPPDLVIADIEMPVMDGLALARNIRTAFPDLPIIILTSHRDFAYARDSVKLAVTDFILKSEVDSHLLKTIVFREYEKACSRRKESYSPVNQLIRSRFILNFLSNEQYEIPDENQFMANHIALKDRNLCAMAINITDGHFDENSQKIFRLDGADYVENVLGFLYSDEIYVFLMNIKSENASSIYQLNLLHSIASSICRHCHCPVGVSMPCRRGYTDIRLAVRQAVWQLSLSFYDTAVKVFSNAHQFSDPDKIRDEIKVKTKEIIQDLETMRTFEYRKKLDTFFDWLETERYPDTQLIKSSVILLLKTILTHWNIEQRADSQTTDWERPLYAANSLEALRNAADSCLDSCIIPHNTDHSGLNRKIFYAKQFIHTHFSENISLNDVADAVRLNPEYLSRLFKSETGTGYTEYLTHIRLSHAKKLLKNTDMKVHEIASAVGYPNLSYFSSLFKKQYGLSPFDYKNI